jgi:hypothetical protein
VDPSVNLTAFNAVVNDILTPLAFALTVAPLIVNPKPHQKNDPRGEEKEKDDIEPGIGHWRENRLRI